MEEERYYDKKIDLLVQQLGNMNVILTQIQQRQSDFTIPKLEKIEHCLFGNGKIGLVEEHIICLDRQKIYEKLAGKVSGLIIAITLSTVTFLTGYAVLFFKVSYIWDKLIK